MQPTYLPWLGYFAMISSVDLFIFLDTPQFAYRSWQQRNRILRNGVAEWLTVPVHRPDGRNTLLRDVSIAYEGVFPRRHLDIVKESYGNEPTFQVWYDWLASNLQAKASHLVDLTSGLILSAMHNLNISTPTVFARDFPTNGSSSSRLLELVQAVGGTTYVAAQGSRDYLDNFHGFEEAGISLEYSMFDHPIYNQRLDSFVSHLSFLDAAVRLPAEALQKIVNK